MPFKNTILELVRSLLVNRIKVNCMCPLQLLCATVFLLPAWYLTSQPLDINRMGLAWLTCALVTILAQTFGFVVGAACGMKVGTATACIKKCT